MGYPLSRKVHPVRNSGIILRPDPAAEPYTVPRFAGYRAEQRGIISNRVNSL